MDLSTTQYFHNPTPVARRVRVPGRDDIGVIVEPGKNFGAIYCYGIHFPETGECLYFETKRVTEVKDGTAGL